MSGAEVSLRDRLTNVIWLQSIFAYSLAADILYRIVSHALRAECRDWSQFGIGGEWEYLIWKGK